MSDQLQRGAPVDLVVAVCKAAEKHGVTVLRQEHFNRLTELLGEMLASQEGPR